MMDSCLRTESRFPRLFKTKNFIGLANPSDKMCSFIVIDNNLSLLLTSVDIFLDKKIIFKDKDKANKFSKYFASVTGKKKS